MAVATRALCVALGMLAAALPAQEAVHVTLGLYSFKKPTEVYKQFSSVARALEVELTAELGKPATVQITVTKTYEECLEDFLAGKVDIVRFGPASYVLAKNRNARIELLAAEREDAKDAGLIVVRENSPIRTLADLRGTRFAFGDEQSTIGRYLSQAQLVKAGITAKELSLHRFLERHDIVFKVVELGDFEAGALHRGTFKELNAKAPNKLRVLHSFDNVAKPWIARADMDPVMVKALRASLLRLDDPQALTALKVPGMEPTKDGDYDLIREGMKLSERFAVPVAEPAPTPNPAPGKGQ